MASKKIDHGIKTVETMADGLAKDHQVYANNNDHALTRLVWFVAIAGFALLNVNRLAADIIGEKLTRIQLVLLILPWVFVALSGVVTHYLIGETVAEDNKYYVLMQHTLRAWLAYPPAKPTVKEVLEILNIDETDDDLIVLKKKAAELSEQANTWENITLVGLIFSFLWSVIFPLLLS
jgi:hypothetical protein